MKDKFRFNNKTDLRCHSRKNTFCFKSKPLNKSKNKNLEWIAYYMFKLSSKA
jgi:hypothetical protein